MKLTVNQIELFWSRVDKNGPLHPYNSVLGRCWLWVASNTGGADKSGYGIMSINRKKGYRAHCLSWEIVNKRKIPKNKIVCHSCDVRRCINPDHLFLGTDLDNYLDCVKKGRHLDPPPQLGEQNHFALLTEKEVKEIKRRSIRLNKTRWNIKHEDLAKEFGVSRSCIKKIRLGKNWKNV